jgi:hypothetical protein
MCEQTKRVICVAIRCNNNDICSEPFKVNWTNFDQNNTYIMLFMFVKVDNRYKEYGESKPKMQMFKLLLNLFDN